MLDIGWSEMAIVAVIALIVVGPKDLPKALRTVRAWIAKLRSMAREFQSGVDDLVREADLQDVRKEVESIAQEGFSDDSIDAFDPTGGDLALPAVDDAADDGMTIHDPDADKDVGAETSGARKPAAKKRAGARKRKAGVSTSGTKKTTKTTKTTKTKTARGRTAKTGKKAPDSKPETAS